MKLTLVDIAATPPVTIGIFQTGSDGVVTSDTPAGQRIARQPAGIPRTVTADEGDRFLEAMQVQYSLGSYLTTILETDDTTEEDVQ